MKQKNKVQWLKYCVVFFLTLAIFGLVSAGTISIPSTIDNALQVIKRLFITDDGTQTGNPIMDINTWWSVIVYGPLLDSLNNPYLIWYTETDPVWIAEK